MSDSMDMSIGSARDRSVSHPGAKSPSPEAPIHVVSQTKPALSCYLHFPRADLSQMPVLVTVHGISRNAVEHIELFRSLADQYGVILVAPVFPAAVFKDYQRLGRKGLGPRADLALIRLLNELAIRMGLETSKVDLFGFSGGAQFAHRFALVHPSRIRRLALGAAGWYTMPDESVPYPHGAGDAGTLNAARFNVLALARLPTLVMVGECDNEQDDEDLNKDKIVIDVQGTHRLARAQAWKKAMNDFSATRGEDAGVELVMLPGVDHSFRDAVLQGGMAAHLFRHCYLESGSNEYGGTHDAQ